MKKHSLDFFLPFEFDQVPKISDLWEDNWDKNSGKLFIWDCFKEHPYDGLLISKSKFDDNKKKYLKKLEKNRNLKDLLKIPEKIKLFGDCGAFQYRNEELPRYNAKEILDYYQNFGFDMGCSVDHIILNKKDKIQRLFRYKINKEYAKKCIDVYNTNEYSFELFGVAQGWDIKSYVSMVKFLNNLGYRNICIGGLVGLKTINLKYPKEFTLVNLIHRLKDVLKKYKFDKVHIFGRGNIELFELYIKTGITQFDNNIMRKAWTDEKKSYYYFEKENGQMKYYTSIRIPLIKNHMEKHEDEKEIFESLRQMKEGNISNEDFIFNLEEYYKLYSRYHPKKIYKVNENLLKILLKEKPWNKCRCDICKKNGIHVCVFRRRMRNTLRAFHNVYNYYAFVQNIRTSKINSSKVLSLTNFTGN